MAVRISDLPAAAGATSAMQFEVNNAGTSQRLTLAQMFALSTGAVVADSPLLSFAQTWNNAAVAFTALKLNITDTASAAGSKLVDYQVGGTSKFSVTKDGCVLLPNGSASAPALAFASSTNSGFYHTFLGRFIYVANGVAKYYFSGGTLQLVASGVFSWSPGSDPTSVSDLFLSRDAAGTLALRNGTNGQAFNLYGSSTDASNYERLFIGHSNSASFHIQAQNAGTGAARNIVLAAGAGAHVYLGDSTNRWNVQGSTGHLFCVLDNTYDIGASGASRPRHLFLGSDLTMGGVLRLGGSTNSFPSLKRNAAALEAKLADDSAYASFACDKLEVKSGSTAAPSTTAGSLAVTEYFGEDATKALTAPIDWLEVTVNGVVRKIPAY